jgi:uncharacterized membrane protein YbaN (DUF454 family)
MPAFTAPLFALLGLLCTGLGLLGLAVPLLPTTPFLLVAAYCFSRGSPRLHRRLLDAPVLGQLLADWERHGAIRPRAKWLASATLLLATAWPVASGRVPTPLLPLVAAVVLGVLWFLWTRPALPAADAQQIPEPDVDGPRADA